MVLKNRVVTALALCLTAELPGRGQGLEVTVGTPLHIRLNSDAPIRAGERVRGALVHPLYVFDRQVLPAGTEVSGAVSTVLGASRAERLRAYLHGRLRTRKDALVRFDGIVLEDGRTMPLHTSAAAGRPFAMVRVTGESSQPGKQGALNQARRRAGELAANHDAVQAARALASSQSRSGFVRAVLAGLKNEALSYWPFGPQRLPRGTAYAAVLTERLAFIAGPAKRGAPLGIAPPAGAVVRVRLTQALSSATARAGSPLSAVTMEPVFSESGALLLPAGTGVRGEVAGAASARRFGRNGKLQLRFTGFDPGEATPGLAAAATVEAVESGGPPGMKLDAEGLASVPVSKKRFIYPALAAGLAVGSVPDAENAVKVHGGAPGWSGFGLAGAGAALATHAVAGPLGWWGVANAAYFNLLRKAGELELPAHTVLEIRVGRPTGTGPALAGTPRRPPARSPQLSFR